MNDEFEIVVTPSRQANRSLGSAANLSILNMSTQSPAILKKNKKGETPLQIAVIKVRIVQLTVK